MTTINVTKNDEGKLTGATEKDQRAYRRFRKTIDELEPGELFTLDVWFPRNPKLHKLHFAMLTALYDAQEQFDNPKKFRKWLEVGAGHCDFLPGPTGKMVAIPKSIGYDELDDVQFQEHHEAVKEFMRTLHATRFLWPHLDDQTAGELVESILQEFEREPG